MVFTNKYPQLGNTSPLRIPTKLHSHVLHIVEMYESVCVTHGIENVLHLSSYVEKRLKNDIDRLQEDV